MTDFIIGFFIGQFTAPVLGPWTLLLGLATGALWWMAGQGILGTKLWRILGVPILVTAPFMLHAFHWWQPLCLAAQCAWCTVGWSVPDQNQPKASWIGTWYWRHLGHPTSGPRRDEVDLLTRGTWITIFILTIVPLWVKP